MNKIKILNKLEIKNILNMNMALNAVESAYSQKNSLKGNVWPLVFYEYEHNVFDLDIRLGNLEDQKAYGLKLISYNENNVGKGLDKVNATSLIFDSNTGQPLALLNSSPITLYRTGAAAGIGAKYLARQDSKNLLVVGCGNIAVYSVVAILLTMPKIENIFISNPKDYESLTRRIDSIKQKINELLEECNVTLKANIECVNNLEKYTKVSDIIVTATPSEEAMIKFNWVKEGTHFSCMGACMEGKQEIDENIFSKAIVFADDEIQCLKQGETQTAYKKHIILKLNGEIGKIILNKKQGRESAQDITIFDSTGLFIQDLATSIEVLNHSNNVGKEVEL